MLSPLFLLALFQDPATFRSDVALVRVDAEVRPADDLKQEDFLVTDGGKRQPILFFGHQETPLDVILLFDTSASMRSVVARVAEAAHTALSELHEGDRVAVMAFDSTTDLITDFTGDFTAAEESISKQVLTRHFRCCSPIQGALESAARIFQKQPSSTRRRAIVILTDDEGTSRDPGALRQLWEADAVVLGVIVRGPGFTIQISPSSFRDQGMRSLALETGGDTLKTSDAAEGLRETLHRLRLRYSLYYAVPLVSPGTSPLHKIKVQLAPEAARRHPGAILRARSGYILR
ncbi:MAG TPA: VWA domain-containing protein [Bryobacteraceae bacterium]|jgi:VWFA-related protein